MKQRLKKIDRLLNVQRQLHKLSEWKLADLHSRKAELEQTQVILINTLNNDENLYGLFVDATAKRLQRLAGQSSEVEAARVIQKEITFERAMQVKRTEKMASTLKEANRRELEKKTIEEIVDALISK
ncbi:hypothetical protein [Microvirga sp. 2TAF3]|uniref:hypothetical protein n=1 Tax=Microvirga sp. 2TAF3 TaxID=3233014 RepID=UPI003F965379